MRIVKSLHSGVIHRTFEMSGQKLFTLGSLWGFELSSGKPLLEKDVWTIVGERMPEGAIFDAGYPKVCSEYLVAGSFLSAEPVGGSVISARVADREKKLAVFGDRYWNRTSFDGPETISELPISFEQAFGGKGYSKNPTGKGMDEVDHEGVKRIPLPNVEYHSQLMSSHKDRPEPASFGPLDVTWAQRQSLSGTYDQRYIEEYMPGFPADIDSLFFNCAARDQWLEGYLVGSEAFSFTGMNLEFPVLQGVLPSIRSRLFVEVTQDEVARFVELDNQLDTVWFFPNDDMGVVIHRGSYPVETSNASEVSAVMLAHENLSDVERSLEHYQDQFAKRTDLEHGFKYMVNTRDLIPLGVSCGFDEIMGVTDQGTDPGRANLANYVDQQLGKGKAKVDEILQESSEGLAIAGIKERTVDEMMQKKSTPTPEQQQIVALIEKIVPGHSDSTKAIDLTTIDLKAMDELNDYTDQLNAEKMAEVKETLNKHIEQLKQDGQAESAQLMEEALASRELPPLLPRPAKDVQSAISTIEQQRESIQREMHIMASMGLDTQQLNVFMSELKKSEAELEASKQQMTEIYRLAAHNVPEARSPHEGQEEQLAAEFRAKLTQGKDLEYWDGAFTELSKVEVVNVSLQGCFLEHASLVEARVTGVNLNEAILSHANMSNASFSQVSFKAANLGGCLLKQALFKDCDFTDASLGKARLSGAVFERCQFQGRMDAFLEADLSGATFIDCEMNKCIFYELTMAHCRFEKTRLDEANFVECELEGAQFQNSSLAGVNFVSSVLNSASFRDSVMHNSRFVGGCQLEQGDFKGCKATLSNFRENSMSGADFTGADVSHSDFSGATLVGACFIDALTRQTLFIESNLECTLMTRLDAMEASFQNARLTGADFREANLYSANFYGVIVGKTDFSSANLKKTLFKDWRPSRDQG